MYIDSFQFISSPFVVFLGALPVVFIGNKLRLSFSRIICVYAWHTLFTFIYSLYVIGDGGDALNYFDTATKLDFNTSLGNIGVILPAAFLRHVFDLSFLNISIIFGMLGAIGLLFFDAALQTALLAKKNGLKDFQF